MVRRKEVNAVVRNCNVSSPLMAQCLVNMLERTYKPEQMREEHAIPDKIFKPLYYQGEEYTKVVRDTIIGNIFFSAFLIQYQSVVLYPVIL